MEQDVQQRYIELLMQSGCKPTKVVTWFGKDYIFLRSQEGTLFVERLPEKIDES